MILLVVKFTDIGAYFGGRALGRHKLIPWLSPGKTWEGLVLRHAHRRPRRRRPVAAAPASRHPGLTGGRASSSASVIGGIGQLGDLLESLMKRDAEVKDSGQLDPRLRRHPRRDRQPPAGRAVRVPDVQPVLIRSSPRSNLCWLYNCPPPRDAVIKVARMSEPTTTTVVSVRCNHCGARSKSRRARGSSRARTATAELEIHRSGGADLHRGDRPDQPTTERIERNVEQIKRQNAVEQLDREWDMRRQTLLVRNKNGSADVPSSAAARSAGSSRLSWASRG